MFGDAPSTQITISLTLEVITFCFVVIDCRTGTFSGSATPARERITFFCFLLLVASFKPFHYVSGHVNFNETPFVLFHY